MDRNYAIAKIEPTLGLLLVADCENRIRSTECCKMTYCLTCKRVGNDACNTKLASCIDSCMCEEFALRAIGIHRHFPFAHCVAVLLSLFGYSSHGLNSFERILAAGSLARKHKSVGIRIDSVGNISNLGTCGAWVLDHSVKHLSGHNHGLLLHHTLADDLALNARNTLNRNLNTKVATRNHYTIRSVDNLLNIVNTLLILNLRNDLDVAIVLVKNLLDCHHVGSRTHERVGYEVNILLNSKQNVLTVFLGNGRQSDVFARNIHTLMCS